MIHTSQFHSFSLFGGYSLVQGYFERSAGNITQNGELDTEVLASLLHFLRIDKNQLKLMKQCHGNTVAEVNQTSPLITENVDALVTVSKELVLGVKTADCIPLIFFDPIHNITSAVHAGYKGLLVGIIQNTLHKMAELGSTISNVMVGIGPCICKSCYNVEKERIDMFSEKYPGMETFYEKKSDTYLLDIKAIALYILHTNGIQKDNIDISSFCTKEDNEKFFSRRVEEKGVFLSVIGMI